MTVLHTTNVVLSTVLIMLAACNTFTTVLLSDLHYDPFYGTGKAYLCSSQALLRTSALGSSGCDSPLPLLVSAVDDITNLKPTATMIAGDWLRHGMSELPSSDIYTTLDRVAEEVARLDNTSVQWTLGNDDLVPDYYFNVSSLLQLRDFGVVMVNRALLSIAEKASFEDCGYFYRDMENVKIRVVSLNTMLWSSKIQPTIPAGLSDPCGQFRFLNNTLQDAIDMGYFVILLGHIPPGLDVHSAITQDFSASSMFWDEDYQEEFLSIVLANRAYITLMLFGHTHMTSFIADVTAMPVPTWIVPSISPIFTNSPSYLIATVDYDTGRLEKLQHRLLSFDTQSWGNGGELSAKLKAELWNVTSLAGVAQSLLAGGSVSLSRADFLSIYSANGDLQSLFLSGGHCDDACGRVLYCSMLYVRYADIRQCTRIPEVTNFRLTNAATIVFTTLSTLVFLGGLMMLVIRRRDFFSVPLVANEDLAYEMFFAPKQESKPLIPTVQSSVPSRRDDLPNHSSSSYPYSPSGA